MTRPLLFSLGLAALVCLPACSGGPLTKVTGVVMLDGKPLHDAVVVFVPADPKLRTTDSARTDPEGKFVIESNPRRAGLKPGNYKVYITKWVDKKTGKAPPEQDMDQLRLGGKLKNALPDRYSKRTGTAVLTAEVNAGDTELPPFELTSKKK